MKDNTKPELMKLLGITDSKVADDIISYSQMLSAPKRIANDFSLAKELNECITIEMYDKKYKEYREKQE